MVLKIKMYISFAILLLTVNVAFSQIGTVTSYQQITAQVGGFNVTLDYNDRFGASMDSIGDLNDDGIMDIAVGAHRDDDGGTDRGAVYILFMDTNKTVKSHAKISHTSGNLGCALQNSACFGTGVAGLGDLDGDGIEDIVVGGEGDSDGGFNTGAVWILYMNTNGTVKLCKKISALSGYLNGGLPLASGKHFGNGVDCVGDIDGDNVMDIVVENYHDNGGGTNKGAVWVLLLYENGTVKSHYKIYDGVPNFNAPIDDYDYFGSIVCGINDIDNDGVPDIAVGAYYDDDGGANCGAVYLIKLNSNGSVKGFNKISNGNGGMPINSIPVNAQFGTDMRTTADLDGNGHNDLMVGASSHANGGAVYFLGLDSNLNSNVLKKVTYTDIPLITNDVRFGRSVCHIGDIDNDGTMEVAAGATYYNGERGEIFVYSITVAFSTSISVTPKICENSATGTATAQPIGGNPPYSYLWSNGSTNASITNIPHGIYSVTVTDASNNSTSASATIDFYPAPQLFIGNDTLIGITESILLDAGSGYIGYEWNGLSGNSTFTVHGSDLGYGVHPFPVAVIDYNFCYGRDTIIITVGNTDIEDVSNKNNRFSISPNPAYNRVEVKIDKFTGKNATLLVIDSYGSKVFEKFLEPNSQNISINTSEWSSGLYQIIWVENNISSSQKLLITR
ncbi:MAG: FG-GAP repeat protein [Bacteroidales bacterium]|nr:FG-GAP repeat protein [Bacteroidales bacterium]